MNQKASHHILRVGMAITFIWIGVLILKSPESWGGYVQSWVMKLMPISINQALISTAFLDIAIGVFLLIDYFTWIAALVGTLHLAIVLIVSGITDITVRDIAIMAGTLALAFESFPLSLTYKFKAWRNKNTKVSM